MTVLTGQLRGSPKHIFLAFHGQSGGQVADSDSNEVVSISGVAPWSVVVLLFAAGILVRRPFREFDNGAIEPCIA